MSLTTFSSVLQGPRWLGIESFLRNEAWTRGLEIEAETDKGWVRESVRFRVKGDENKVREFVSEIQQAMDAYNQPPHG